MLVFYSFERWLRITIGVIGGAAVIAQSIHIIIDSMRYDWESHFNQRLFEFIILLNLIVLAAIAPMLNYILRDGFMAKTVFSEERVAVYIPMLIFTGIRLKKSKYLLLIGLLMMTLMLPFFQEVQGKLFFLNLCLVLLYFMVRGIWYSAWNYRALNREISVRSIKEAMDTLPSGIAFASTDGTILLINQKMADLMIQISGDVSREVYRWFSKLRRVGYR